MGLDELLLGESEDLEYKVSEPENRDKYLKTVVAFANGRGGKLIFGVEDETLKVVGVPQDEIFSTMDAITNAIQDSCEPKIIPRNSIMTVEDKLIIVVEILPGMQTPYYIKHLGLRKGVYLRVAGTTRPAENYQVQEMILRGANRSFDQQPTSTPIDASEADAFCERLYAYAKKLREMNEHLQAAPLPKLTRNQLLSWKLLHEQGGQLFPSNGYLLLDGKHSDAFDDPYIQCGVFKGTTRSVFLTMRDFHGPLYEQIENAYTFVLQYITLIPEIHGIVRQDVYELPTRSIREMIVNAVCHRSYLNPGQIQVALYDDRLEVSSPGELASDMTIEKMRRGISVTRNKVVAEAFKYMGIIEKWGSGIPRMIEDVEAYGLRPLKLEDLDGFFRIEMYRRQNVKPGIAIKTIQKTNQKPEIDQKTDQKTETNQKTIPKTDQILRVLREKPETTQRECAELLKWSISITKYYFNILQKKGILRRVGTNRSGYWEILTKAAKVDASEFADNQNRIGL